MSGRGRGVFVRDDPGVVRDCVTGYTWTFDATDRVLKCWDGSAWRNTCLTQWLVPVSTGATFIGIPNGPGSSGQALTSNGASAYPTWQTPTAAIFTTQLTGLTLSNNGTDPTNDIQIDPGAAASDETTIANRKLMTMTCTLIKRLDAAWAQGNNQGMLDTGAVANDVYHLFLISKTADQLDSDIIASTSATTPSMPSAAWNLKRRIGSVVRLASSNVPIRQRGRWFDLYSPRLDITHTGTGAGFPGTNALTCGLASIPDGVPVMVRLHVFTNNDSTNHAVYISATDTCDVAASLTAAPLGSIAEQTNAAATNVHGGQVEVWSDCSACIRIRYSAGGSGDDTYFVTVAYYDPRGQD